jgi:FeS assembly SUF system protein
MSNTSDTDPAAHHHPLTVLPSSGKVEQLKHESASASGSIPLPPGPKHPTPAYVPHVNRTRKDPQLTDEQKALEEKVINAIRTVYDPEIPINIYELGLIYDIELKPENEVYVRMTLTAPACPVAGTLPIEVEKRIESIPEVKSAQVEIVWDPPWGKEMMSEAARLQLGL